MNRRRFFAFLGIAPFAAPAAVKAIAEVPEADGTLYEISENAEWVEFQRPSDWNRSARAMMASFVPNGNFRNAAGNRA